MGDRVWVGCVGVCVWNIWIDVKLLPRSSITFWSLLQFNMQGDHPCTVCDGPTKRPEYMRISRLITVTYLPIHFKNGKRLSQAPPCRHFPIHTLQSISERWSLQSYQFFARCSVLFCTNHTFQANNSRSCSKQVCPSCRLDKMIGTPRGMPFQAVFSTFDLISEFTHFNPVIRFK